MSSDQIFEFKTDDTMPVKLLKEELESAISRYKYTLGNHAQTECRVCTFNFATIQKQFDRVTELKSAILKLVDHSHLWIEM